ncbi:MAG: helix-turn-helix transcriptional regulator [Erysipelotrichaceae bacterium]|nr:helix-turn-helix transcriptional regulator [Erysipelotrichaceae bacterium]MCI9525083.1 helix-turn-helix transcriptional regulator [Erysipelotrichaceae bacterium]
MILADKIIRLRKKNGWSQEELAVKMDVSRQAVAKWEGAQSVPNLEKLIQLSELFQVTTDYLLKDEMENEEFIDNDTNTSGRRITLEEANAFLAWRASASIRIAVSTFICILSVMPLLILGAMSEETEYGISESFAGALGMSLLLIMVAVAVVNFVYCGFRNAPYAFLEKESFECEYGVKGMVKEKQKIFHPAYVKCNMIGSCICVISPIPLLIGSFTENDFLMVIMLVATIFLAGIGVMFFIYAGVRWTSMQKLLKEGDFTLQEKRKNKIKEDIGSIYWLIVTAIYLGWSLITNKWGITWIIWPVAGVLFGGLMCLCNIFVDKE